MPDPTTSNPSDPNSKEAGYPVAALRTIADTSRYEAATEERDLDAACALDAMRVMPLSERVKLVVWLLREDDDG